jgi:hypothetical protein
VVSVESGFWLLEIHPPDPCSSQHPTEPACGRTTVGAILTVISGQAHTADDEAPGAASVYRLDP